MTPAELIEQFGLRLEDGRLFAERNLTPAEVETLRPHRKAILRALAPTPIRLVPMEADTMELRRRAADVRMAAAEDLLDTARRESGSPPEAAWDEDGTHLLFWRGFSQWNVPACLRPEVLWLLREAPPALQRPGSGLRWIGESGGGAA